MQCYTTNKCNYLVDFILSGYGDCAWCFYCGVRFLNWEVGDDAWIVHVQYHPDCGFIQQKLDKGFIETVRRLSQHHRRVTFQMVKEQMKAHPSGFHIDSKKNPSHNHPAIQAVLEVMGGDLEEIRTVATQLRENGQSLSAHNLFLALEDKRAANPGFDDGFQAASASVDIDKELVRNLKQENEELRMKMICKICKMKVVEIVFLPCGHLIFCIECAMNRSFCPLCKKQIKGTVHALL
ncbi:baculoviral iap repeat-containing protein 7 [Plakobranchus ocellatus]|uniref:Baculoviral iap repeat-containing protein 7 n=1 Tax=Plakobranchus ocellatus TaxID=259542 RepID=A0AAV4DG84_9GAST|nr:baculoviral iap repeat-containing protein 7 [Plakobranchus ocellatus]